MPVKIKICGITRAEDAETLLRLRVDALGLVFYEPSPRCLSLDAAQALSRLVAGRLWRVGVFVDAPRPTVQRAVDEVGLDVLQFHGAEAPDFCASFGLPYLKSVSMDAAADAQALGRRHPQALAMLLDAPAPGHHGGIGQSFDWRRWPQRPAFNCMLAGGLKPGNVRQAVRRLRPWGVDVSSGVEAEAPGIKDAGKLRRFVAEVRSADLG